MAPPKRKSPEKKKTERARPSTAKRLLAASVAAITRYPRTFGGVAIFGIVFSFIAANALWYQPRHHPSPLIATRLPGDETGRKAALRTALAAKTDSEPGVTTFRIERQEDLATPADTDTAAAPVASELVRKIQAALAARGLYDGVADGLIGPRTTAAILFYQETEGLDQTGDISETLLASLTARQGGIDSPVAVVPVERPSPDMTASTRKADPLAELIRAAETDPVKTSARKTSQAVKPAQRPVSAEDVMKIQRALTKFAFADVKADGIAGEATRAAIRSFEKNYGLPVTGEPSERVLKKLKSIGAI